jgi:hypothetical protein
MKCSVVSLDLSVQELWAAGEHSQAFVRQQQVLYHQFLNGDMRHNMSVICSSEMLLEDVATALKFNK